MKMAYLIIVSFYISCLIFFIRLLYYFFLILKIWQFKTISSRWWDLSLQKQITH